MLITIINPSFLPFFLFSFSLAFRCLVSYLFSISDYWFMIPLTTKSTSLSPRLALRLASKYYKLRDKTECKLCFLVDHHQSTRPRSRCRTVPADECSSDEAAAGAALRCGDVSSRKGIIIFIPLRSWSSPSSSLSWVLPLWSWAKEEEEVNSSFSWIITCWWCWCWGCWPRRWWSDGRWLLLLDFVCCMCWWW